MPVILATWEAEIRRITGSRPAWTKKLARPPPISTNKLGIVVHSYRPSYTGGIGRRISIQAGHGWGKLRDSISKITKAKRAGGEAQVVEHLPSKHKILSSNSSTRVGKKRNRESGYRLLCHGDNQKNSNSRVILMPACTYLGFGFFYLATQCFT
jgi:hypothetical protein